MYFGIEQGMLEFHYDYIKYKYGNNSRVLFTDTDSLMNEIKSEDFYGDFSNDKEMCGFSNCSAKSKYYKDSDKLVVCKMIDETVDVVIEEFIRFKRKMYSFLVGDNSQQKKLKCVNKHVVATICHNEYKHVLLNKICLRHSMNRIQN